MPNKPNKPKSNKPFPKIKEFALSQKEKRWTKVQMPSIVYRSNLVTKPARNLVRNYDYIVLIHNVSTYTH